jgi:hypothetical protein
MRRLTLCVVLLLALAGLSWADEQVSHAVTLRAHYVASGEGKTGLGDVTCTVYGPDRTKLVNAASATEVGDGLYEYELGAGNTADVGEYSYVFKTSDGTVDQAHLAGQISIGRGGVEYLDAAISSRADATHYTSARAAKLDLISGGSQIEVVSPVATDATVTTYQGDDYYSAESRALSWQDDDWGDFTGDTVTLVIAGCLDGDLDYTSTAAVGGDGTITLELASTVTETLRRGSWRYSYVVTQGGHDETVVDGVWVSKTRRR